MRATSPVPVWTHGGVSLNRAASGSTKTDCLYGCGTAMRSLAPRTARPLTRMYAARSARVLDRGTGSLRHEGGRTSSSHTWSMRPAVQAASWDSTCTCSESAQGSR